jgi:Sugar-transfer associated ATP-grasp
MSDSENQQSIASRLAKYRGWMQQAREQTGKSFATQIREISSLRSFGGQCGVSDYYWHKLYDESYQVGRGARDFLGWKLQQPFSLALNPRDSVLPAWDKSVFKVLATSAGLPVAPIKAFYSRAKRISPLLGVHLPTPEATAGFLKDHSVYPLFAKPAYSEQGLGSAYLKGYDGASDSLVLIDDSTLPLAAFLQRLKEPVNRHHHRPEAGFIFCEPLKPASEIQAITQWSAVCSVRVVCLNGADEVKPIRAVWKIAVAPNHVDNFSMGRYGNLLGNVDLDTGEVSGVIDGFWPETRILTRHPVTGVSFAGFHLPGWNQVLEICRNAGAVFPRMKLHTWDIALTDEGPVILELNDLGGSQLPQMHGRGLLTGETREFLKRYGGGATNSWIANL